MSTRLPRRRQVFFVGSKIRHLRKERNLTQSELAHRVGVQQSDLCRMENGEYKVSLDTMFKILGVFGMNIGEFFRDERAAASVSHVEDEVLRLFRSLDAGAQDEVLDFIRYKSRSRSEAWKG